MSEDDLLHFIEESLSSARRVLMTLAIEDPRVRQGLWFVVREGSAVVRRLRAGAELDDDIRNRIETILRTLDSTGPRVMARIVAARSPYGTRPPWRAL